MAPVKRTKQPGTAVAIARLEEQMVAHEIADTKTFTHLEEQLAALTASVNEINRKLSNQKGFFAGVTFVISGIVALIATAVNYLPWRS